MSPVKCLVWSFSMAMLIGCGAAVADKGQGGAEASAQASSGDMDQTDVGEQNEEPVPAIKAANQKDPAAALASVFAEDLAHTPPNAYLVAVMRPAKMSELEGVQAIPGADFPGSNPVRPSEIERVVAAVYPDARNQMLGIGVVLQLRVQIPRDKIIAWLSPGAEVFADDERIYVDPEWEPDSVVLGFVDDHTILASYDPGFVFDQLRATSAEESARHSLAPAFADVDPAVHAVVVADMARLTHFVQVMSPDSGASLMEQIEPLQLATLASVAINLKNSDGLVFHVQNDLAADGEELGKLVKAMLFSKAASSIATLRETLGNDFAEPIESVQQRVTAILEGSTLQSSETSSTIKSRTLPAAGDAMKLVADIGVLHAARLRTLVADLRFKGNMQWTGLAIHNYHASYRELPRDIVAEDGKPLLSWRVALLPYVEESDLYSQFHLDEPWDSEHNLKLMQQVPRVYTSRCKGEPMKTSIQWASGTSGAAKSFDEIQGMGQVIALIESAEPVHWTRPADFVFDPDSPAQNLRLSGSFGILYDASAVYLFPDTDPDLLRSAFSNGGEEFDVERLRYTSDSHNGFSPVAARVHLSDERFAKLTAGLNSENPSAVTEALQALGQPQPKSPDPRAQTIVDKAVELLDSQSPLLRGYALRVIGQWRRHASVPWQPIAILLSDPYEANRWLAINILKDYPQAELVQAMLRLPSADAVAATGVLRNEYASIAADAAAELLKDVEPSVRSRACDLIGETGDDSHIAKLKPLLDDKRPAVREAARGALQRLQQQGPLAAAVQEFDGDLTAALMKVATGVQTDEDGNPVAINLTQVNTPFLLLRTDFPLLAKLSELKTLKLTYSNLMASDVAHLEDLPLEELQLNYCSRLDDAVAESLRGMTMLRSLQIEHTNVGDRTAAAIGQLPNLEELDMANTRITDKGLTQFGKLRQLQSLNLSDTRITDTGLAALAGHTQLRELYLLNNGITDAAIPHLKTLQGLQFINLSGCELSSEGLAQLRAALPNCRGL